MEISRQLFRRWAARELIAEFFRDQGIRSQFPVECTVRVLRYTYFCCNRSERQARNKDIVESGRHFRRIVSIIVGKDDKVALQPEVISDSNSTPGRIPMDNYPSMAR